ncbi:MAG TPA: amidase family protein, partial [Pyrinomonadaceae bacterium]|nr:amidase family protein [Pyrinomonadaceae bacterium]
MGRKGKVRTGSGSSRRDFLRSGAIAGVVALSQPAVACAAQNSGTVENGPAVRPFELEELTVAELQAGMKSGKWTARSLVEKYLSRIEEIDKRGPAVNSVIELNPDAQRIAEKLDEERKAGNVRGPLHGVPVLIKDNIDTADRMTTTAGSLALAGSVPPKDSFVAQRLRAAGAVILGKTNLSEWAN